MTTLLTALRIGEGWDIHQLVAGRPLVLGGITIAHSHGLLGHSDADALLHAITDALLGAAALGDIGRHFPDTDPQFKGVDSGVLLAEAARLLASASPGPEIRAILPAKDFALSQRFYADLGFEAEFARDGLAGFRLGHCAFLLQDLFVAEHASKVVMVLNLPDLAAFWQGLQRRGVVDRYSVRVEPPQQRPWGRVDMTLTDPSGVLWRIAQHLEVA